MSSAKMTTMFGLRVVGCACVARCAVRLAMAVAAPTMNCLRFMTMKVSLIVFLTMIDVGALRIKKNCITNLSFGVITFRCFLNKFFS